MLPTTPPTIAPVFELLPFEGGVRVSDGVDADNVLVGDGDPVEDTARVEVDVYTPDAPKIAPGPYSGVSISNVSGRLQRQEEREHKGDNAHHQRYAMHWHPNCFRSGTCCYYSTVK